MHELISLWMSWVQDWGYAGVIVLMAMESSIFPVPSEVVIPPAAILSAQEGASMSFWGVVAAGTFGSWLGSAITYAVARIVGRPVIMRWGKFFFMPPHKVEKAEIFLQRYEVSGVFFARLLPVIRHLISIPAGIVRMGFGIFSLVTVLGSFAWCTVLAWYGHRIGERHPELLKSPEELIRTARNLQPHIIIDNRAELEQDLWTPEQFQPTDWFRHPKTGELVTWEACQTFSGSWGYYRDEFTWKSPEMLIRMLINTVSNGGNLIMNVGPTARGYLDHRAEEALAVYADWMKYNSRSIYGCTKAEPEFKTPTDCRLTQSEDGKRLYIHLYAYPFDNMKVQGLAGKVEYAQFLHDGSEVKFTDGTVELLSDDKQEDDETATFFYLPHVKPNSLVPVIEVFLK